MFPGRFLYMFMDFGSYATKINMFELIKKAV